MQRNSQKPTGGSADHSVKEVKGGRRLGGKKVDGQIVNQNSIQVLHKKQLPSA